MHRVPRVSGMFHLNSAPPERLKAAGLFHNTQVQLDASHATFDIKKIKQLNNSTNWKICTS